MHTSKNYRSLQQIYYIIEAVCLRTNANIHPSIAAARQILMRIPHLQLDVPAEVNIQFRNADRRSIRYLQLGIHPARHERGPIVQKILQRVQLLKFHIGVVPFFLARVTGSVRRKHHIIVRHVARTFHLARIELDCEI